MLGSNDKPQEQLCYSFHLDDLVPQDHLRRKIDRFLDLPDLREHLAPYYSHTDRPPGALDGRTRGPGFLCLLHQLPGSVYESARDVARTVATTDSYRRSRRQRKQAEMLFAYMKRILKMDRLRLRGLSGAQDESLLTATAQNLRRMAKYLGTVPTGVISVVENQTRPITAGKSRIAGYNQWRQALYRETN